RSEAVGTQSPAIRDCEATGDSRVVAGWSCARARVQRLAASHKHKSAADRRHGAIAQGSMHHFQRRPPAGNCERPDRQRRRPRGRFSGETNYEKQRHLPATGWFAEDDGNRRVNPPLFCVRLLKKILAKPAAARVAPFIGCLALTFCQGEFGAASAYWFYFAKTLVGVWLIWEMRPFVAEMRWAVSWEAVAAGIGIFVI